MSANLSLTEKELDEMFKTFTTTISPRPSISDLQIIALFVKYLKSKDISDIPNGS